MFVLACLFGLAASSRIASAPAVPASTSTSATATPVDFDWRHAQGVLFRVHSSRVGASDSLLFGTIHIGAARDIGLDSRLVRQAVLSKHVLVNEVDGTMPWLPRYDHYRFLGEGQSLDKLLGDHAFAELARLLPGHGTTRLVRYKPWVAMTLLEEGEDVPAPGITRGQPSIDHVVEDIARTQGLRLVHLETLEDQLAALDCTLPDEYAVVLRQRLADPSELRTATERALSFYRAGHLAAWLEDIDAMPGLDEKGRVAERQARTCLIEQRNARWIEELEPLLRDGGCFVAVGAIHLTGSEGLLAGLARRGFAVSVQAW
ncbi:TraB/GumN family protein [Dyella sp.]|uniref:TraB/GumN family protein n=1 Tax=Dyella sp. TaxID=1869338 RepID=UPI002ED5B208